MFRYIFYYEYWCFDKNKWKYNSMDTKHQRKKHIFVTLYFKYKPLYLFFISNSPVFLNDTYCIVPFIKILYVFSPDYFAVLMKGNKISIKRPTDKTSCLRALTLVKRTFQVFSEHERTAPNYWPVIKDD